MATVFNALARIQHLPLLDAARSLAAAGVPVFPCLPGGKRPLTTHGFHDATTNLEQITAWWREHPEANLAVPTGASSGVVAVDVDVHGPVDGYRAFERAHRAGLVSGWQLLVTTPSGGMHAYFPAIPGGEQRSWQAARAGIDFRGDGGYIVVPPSTVSTAGTSAGYRVRRINSGATSVLDSDRLREFLDPRPAPSARSGRGVERSGDVSRLAAGSETLAPCIALSSTPALWCQSFSVTSCCSWPPRRHTRRCGGLGSSSS